MPRKKQVESVISQEDYWKSVIKASGIKPEELGKTVRAAIQENENLLKAEKTEFFQNKGEVTETRQIADNTTRMRAIEAIYDLTGVKNKAGQQQGQGQVQINVNIPDYYKERKPVDVTNRTIEHSPSSNSEGTRS